MITFEVESTSDIDLSDWMFNNFEMRSGSITFLKIDFELRSRELNFTDAYPVVRNENFDATAYSRYQVLIL